MISSKNTQTAFLCTTIWVDDSENEHHLIVFRMLADGQRESGWVCVRGIFSQWNPRIFMNKNVWAAIFVGIVGLCSPQSRCWLLCVGALTSGKLNQQHKIHFQLLTQRIESLARVHAFGRKSERGRWEGVEEALAGVLFSAFWWFCASLRFGWKTVFCDIVNGLSDVWLNEWINLCT